MLVRHTIAQCYSWPQVHNLSLLSPASTIDSISILIYSHLAFLLVSVAYLMVWPVPSALSCLSLWSPCPSQTRISALAHLPSYLGRGGPRGAHMDHQVDSSPTTWWLVNYSAKMITPPLARWFLGTWSLNTQAIVRVCNTVGLYWVLWLKCSPFENQGFWMYRTQSCRKRMHKWFKQVTGKDEKWDHFCSCSLVPRTMYLSFGGIWPIWWSLIQRMY